MILRYCPTLGYPPVDRQLELELVYLRRLAIGLRPFAGVGLRLEFDDSTTRYRLARLAPWEGNILTLDQFRQQLTSIYTC